MRIVTVLPKHEPFSPQRGGALATWVHHVYQRISWNVKVVAISDNESYLTLPILVCRANKATEELYVAVHNRSFRELLEPIKFWLRNSYNRQAARLCRSLEPDIIHIQNDYEAVFPIKRMNPQACIILHMQNDHLIEASNLKRAEESCYLADKIAFCSEYLRRNVLKAFPMLPEQKTFVIFNGASEVSTLSPVRQFQNDPCILFVGRIVPQKGLHILLEAIDDVFKRYPEATLRIVGGITFGSQEEDDYLRSLRQKASVWGDRIIFVGPVPHDQIAAEFIKADLFVCPSIWNEPLGMVNAEAMACGLPIVAFARGGIPEVVGNAGILVQDISAKSLAKAINTVLDDIDLRQRLSQRGVERVSTKFSWQTISQVWQQQLQAVRKESSVG